MDEFAFASNAAKAHSQGDKLRKAAYMGKLVEIKDLLDGGADVDDQDAKGRTALYCASLKGHIRIIAVLIEYGAQPDLQAKDGRTAIEVARTSIGQMMMTKRKADQNSEYTGFDMNRARVKLQNRGPEAKMRAIGYPTWCEHRP